MASSDKLPFQGWIAKSVLLFTQRIVGYILFPKVLVHCEIQAVSSRNWTQFTTTISPDNNHYITKHINHRYIFKYGHIYTANIYTWSNWFTFIQNTKYSYQIDFKITLIFKNNNTYQTLVGPSGIRAGRVSNINGRLEVERSSASAGQPLSGRTASLTPLTPLYSTGPRGPV